MRIFALPPNRCVVGRDRRARRVVFSGSDGPAVCPYQTARIYGGSVQIHPTNFQARFLTRFGNPVTYIVKFGTRVQLLVSCRSR